MPLLELGRVLVRIESTLPKAIGVSCYVRKDGPLHKLLVGEEIVYVCKVRNERGVRTGSIIEAIYAAKHIEGLTYEGKLIKESLIQFSFAMEAEAIQTRGECLGGKKLVRLFSNMICKVDESGEDGLYEPVHCDQSKHQILYKVADLFATLRTVDETLAEVEDPSLLAKKSWIECLPDDVLHNIFARCDPLTFRSLQCCSKSLNYTSRESIPSIRTQLCQHQRKSLRWMIWREQGGRKINHLFKQYVPTPWGDLEINEMDSSLKFAEKETLSDTRGGILADEPGLGKTATILSLVMRTRGVLATPPEKSCQFIQNRSDGLPVGWYWFEDPSWNPESDGRLRKTRSGDHQRVPLSPCTSLAPSESHRDSETPNVKRPRTRASVAASKEDEMDWSLSDSVAREYVKTVIEEWICCDACSTWRVVPSSYHVDPSKKWYCRMHPHLKNCSCGQHAKTTSDEDLNVVVRGQSGYILADGGTPSMENFAYFSYVLNDCHNSLGVRLRLKAISTLCASYPEYLHEGFEVPLECRSTEFYVEAYQKLGLVRMAPKNYLFYDKSHRWKIPDTHKHLNLDTFVLSAVMCSTLGQDDFRVYLSRATLIVVPCTLIQQWKEEITKHFHGNHLRVHVLTTKFHYPKSIAQLAWDYDIVLTTFAHMSNPPSKELLRIHWLRVVLDEGHLIGSNTSRTTKRDRIVALKAERRWVITGTPTPDVAHRSAVNNLYPLIQFLKIEPFASTRQNWENAIQKPFEARLPEGRRRLQTLLNTLMIRAFKSHINSLVKVHKQVIRLDFEPAHSASYNELVEVVKRNLLLADFGEDGHEESLLNRSNIKWASQMLRNVNLSCCVAGNCYLEVNNLHLLDTLKKLALRNGLATEFLDVGNWWTPSHHLLRNIESALRFGGTCGLCSDWVRLPLVTPCLHLLCENCIKQDREHCGICQKAYTMQSAYDPARLLHNNDPRLPVPIEVIEWQPSYAQAGATGISGGVWHPDWRATQSSKCKQLVKRLKEIGVMNTNAVHSSTKAIVYSRFWPHIDLIHKSLDDACITHCVLKRDRSVVSKKIAIQHFRSSESCNVLLMDMTGAVGLDLSMAQWVFLMEPLLDRSIEDQVVSRAYRMGAKEDIHVEVMVMKRSVEELVLDCFLRNDMEYNSMDKTELKEDNMKIRNALISGLKRVSKNI